MIIKKHHRLLLQGWTGDGLDWLYLGTPASAGAEASAVQTRPAAFLPACPRLIDGQAGFGLALPVHGNFYLRDQIHGQADPYQMLTQGAQGLHIQLLALYNVTSLLLNGIHHFLRGDRAIQLAGFAGPGAKKRSGSSSALRPPRSFHR